MCFVIEPLRNGFVSANVALHSRAVFVWTLWGLARLPLGCCSGIAWVFGHLLGYFLLRFRIFQKQASGCCQLRALWSRLTRRVGCICATWGRRNIWDSSDLLPFHLHPALPSATLGALGKLEHAFATFITLSSSPRIGFDTWAFG